MEPILNTHAGPNPPILHAILSPISANTQALNPTLTILNTQHHHYTPILYAILKTPICQPSLWFWEVEVRLQRLRLYGCEYYFFFFYGVNASCTDIGWLVRPPDRVWDSYRLVAPTH